MDQTQGEETGRTTQGDPFSSARRAYARVQTVRMQSSNPVIGWLIAVPLMLVLIGLAVIAVVLALAVGLLVTVPLVVAWGIARLMKRVGRLFGAGANGGLAEERGGRAEGRRNVRVMRSGER